MTIVQKPIPEDILKDSLLAHIAGAYFAIGKQLERKTQCSATRGFILSALRGGAALNQNQVAVQLGFDRTVVHRVVKAMIKDGLVSETKARSGRALIVRLTPKGNRYHEYLIKERRAADEKVRNELTPEERTKLIDLLQRVAELEF